MQLPTANAPIAIQRPVFAPGASADEPAEARTRSSASTISGSHATACTWLMCRSRSSMSSDRPNPSAENTAAVLDRVIPNTYAYVKQAASSGPDITTAVHDRSSSPKTTFGR